MLYLISRWALNIRPCATRDFAWLDHRRHTNTHARSCAHITQRPLSTVSFQLAKPHFRALDSLLFPFSYQSMRHSTPIDSVFLRPCKCMQMCEDESCQQLFEIPFEIGVAGVWEKSEGGRLAAGAGGEDGWEPVFYGELIACLNIDATVQACENGPFVWVKERDVIYYSLLYLRLHVCVGCICACAAT